MTMTYINDKSNKAIKVNFINLTTTDSNNNHNGNVNKIYSEISSFIKPRNFTSKVLVKIYNRKAKKEYPRKN